jgi:hypothetical protein
MDRFVRHNSPRKFFALTSRRSKKEFVTIQLLFFDRMNRMNRMIFILLIDYLFDEFSGSSLTFRFTSTFFSPNPDTSGQSYILMSGSQSVNSLYFIMGIPPLGYDSDFD